MSDFRESAVSVASVPLLLFLAAVIAAGLAVAGVDLQGATSRWLDARLLMVPALLVGLVLLAGAGLALRSTANGSRRRALMFVLALGVFAVTVGAAVWYSNRIRSAIAEQQVSHESDLALLKAQTIEKWLFERSLGPNILAASLGQIDTDPGTLDETKKQIIGVLLSEYMAADPERQDVTLFHPDAEVALHLGTAEQPSDAEVQAVKAFAASGARQQYVELNTGDPDGKGLRIAYLRTVPQATPRNGKSSVLVSVLDPAILLFRQLDERLAGDRTSETILVRKEAGKFAFVKRSLGLATGGAPAPMVAAWLAALRRIVDGRAEQVRDYRGTVVLAAAAPVKGIPWHVVVKTDRAETMRPFEDEIGGAVTLVVASIVGGGLMLWLLWAARRV